MRRRVEVGILVCNPREEAADARISTHHCKAAAKEREFRIREEMVESSVTDRMNRDGPPPAAALGQRVMIFDNAAETAAAKPTSRSARDGHATWIR